LDFLLDRSIFYAEDKDIREVTEGIIREDSSLSEEASRGECLLDDD
jgi:hypothetical protein